MNLPGLHKKQKGRAARRPFLYSIRPGGGKKRKKTARSRIPPYFPAAVN